MNEEVVRSVRDRIRELRRVPARALMANPKNWRKHPKGQREAMRAVLAEIGFAGALLAREMEDGQLVLIDGHLRAETAPDEVLPVLVLDVDQAEADKILLTFDPLSSLATIDQVSLDALRDAVVFDNEELSRWMKTFNPGLLSDPEADFDHAHELQVKWDTAPGQLWQIGAHRLYCGDSRQPPPGLFAGDQVRLVWTDPPYGVSYAELAKFQARAGHPGRNQSPIENDLDPDAAIKVFTDAMAAIQKYCHAGAVAYVTVPAGSMLPRFIAALDASGFRFRHSLVWVKDSLVMGRSDYHYRHETILYGWRPDGEHLWVGGRTRDSIFEVARPKSSPLHPTTKPVDLVASMLVNSTLERDIVYDPFCGSGTTLLAAEQLGRAGRGCEFSPAYVAVALQRLSELDLRPEQIDQDAPF